MKQEVKDILDGFFEEKQDWNNEYWKDEKRIKLYMKAIELKMDLPSADGYVKLYDLLGKEVEEDIFYKIERCFDENGTDIMEADNEKYNEEYQMIIQCCKDSEIEQLWEELEDVLFIEAKEFYKSDSDYKDSISLVLASEWRDFPAGTDVETIWHWFDEHHSKGFGWLMNEYESVE